MNENRGILPIPPTQTSTVLRNPDEIFEQTGDTNYNWYQIISGIARRSIRLNSGRRQIIGFSLPGDWIIPPAPDGIAHLAEAVDAVEAQSFSNLSINKMFNQDHELRIYFNNLSRTYLSDAEEHIMLLGILRSEEKIAYFLLMMRDRWERSGKTSITVHLPMPRRDIADYLGVTTETVSRTLSRFSRDGMILPVPQGFRILNLERLTEISGKTNSTRHTFG